MPDETASPLGSVDKALLALEHLAAAGPAGAPLARLAADLGTNKTTLHRTLAALRHRGFAEQADDGAYRLGPAALALSRTFLDEENLAVLLQPALSALVAEVDELVHLGVLSGREIVYLDKLEPARPVRVWSAVGRRRPAATTALGRALLAHRTLDEQALRWYAGDDLSPAALAAVLDAARADGLARETEENEAGIACLAVPLLRAGQGVAAVSVTAPVERLTAAHRAAVERALREQLPPLLPADMTVPPRGTSRA